MKIHFTRVAPLLTFAFKFTNATTGNSNTQGGIVRDRLSAQFMMRVVKSSAANGLSWVEGCKENMSQCSGAELIPPNDKLNSNGVEVFVNTFSENAIMTPFSEQSSYSETGRDDAILIEDDGQCFVSFQSTTQLLEDISQNVNPFKESVCRAENECCEFRQGFVNGWKTQYKEELMENIKDCVSRCNNEDGTCLIIAGHSQGGAIATVASLELSTLTEDYEVFAFAAPPSLTEHPSNCSPHMNFGLHYHFTKALYREMLSGGGVAGLVFDMVAFLSPDPIPGFETFPVGNLIIMSSEDFNHLAYVGFNADQVYFPWDLLLTAHKNHVPPNSNFPGTGYYDIAKRMTETATFPISVGGFANGMHCGRGEYGVDLCSSERCDRANYELHPTCKRKLSHGERCNHDNDCLSGRCDAKDWKVWNMVCHEVRMNGEPCNEDSDCLSGRCPTNFPSKCNPMAEAGEPCANNKDCVSGYYCPAGFRRRCRKRRNTVS